MLTLIDEHTRECLAIDVARNLMSEDVLERLSDWFVRRGAAPRSTSVNCIAGEVSPGETQIG